ncbi:Beta-lactamase [Mycena kentingensis (nom. inval.)]|nr:Beta-lactamase [Mycena kentingensis (nom. inval.)]
MVSFSAAQRARFEEIIDAAVESKATPALSFAISDIDGSVYSYQRGTKVVGDPTSGRIDDETVFWWCSQAKLVTSVHRRLTNGHEQGKITFDTPVASILPELANPVVVTEQDPTTRKILATAPAKNAITDDSFLGGEDVAAFFDVLKRELPGVPLRFEPGTKFAYGFSTDCVGFIVERLSGKTLEQYCQDYIFGPLKMTSTSFCVSPKLKERLLPLSFRNGDEYAEYLIVMDLDANKDHVFLGGVGLYGTFPDYLKLTTHLLRLKARSSVRSPILTSASVDALFEPSLEEAAATTWSTNFSPLNPHTAHCPDGAAKLSRALFVNAMDIPGKRRAGSGSFDGWANTVYLIDPEAGISMVFGTQLSPPADETFCRLYDQLETELYTTIQD